MEDNNIMVSICCITYNQEKFIRQALDGFLMQKTNFKYEIIIHDDASTDNTANIILEYEKKYPDIIKPIYQTENQYSKGKKPTLITYKAAQGKYIALCEGDDYWIDENKLQLQVDYMEKNKPDANYPIDFGYTRIIKNLDDFKASCKPKFELGEEATREIGAIIGTHVGPGAFGVAYIIE